MNDLSFLLARCDEAELASRLRELRVIVRMLVGADSPATLLAERAVAGTAEHGIALQAVDLLPALQRRKVLAMFGEIVWPNKKRRRKQPSNISDF